VQESLNSSIEIHDSVLNSIETTETRLQLFIEAYIPRSTGEPGVDPGSGWTQNVVVTIDNASSEGNIKDLPSDLADGTLQVKDQTLENIIPIPLNQSGQIRLTLVDQRSGDTVVVRGTHISMKLLGDAKYIEEFR
jgi:hypothetical protein